MQPAKQLDKLYKTAMLSFRQADDARIEELRWSIAKGEKPRGKVTPQDLAALFSETESWAENTFTELRATGFIEHKLTHFEWAQYRGQENQRDIDFLMALEAIVILELAKVQAENLYDVLTPIKSMWSSRRQKLSALGLCFKAQATMSRLIAHIGEPELFLIYSNVARPALVYAWASALDDKMLTDLSRNTKRLIKALGTGDSQAAIDLHSRIRSSYPRTPTAQS